MSYVYSKVDELEDTDKVGTKQCVALLQHYAKLPITAAWEEGAQVLGHLTIAKGTAIATFVDGKYKSHSTGNHAAFYLSQDGKGIYVMDQWRGTIRANPRCPSATLGKKVNIQQWTPSLIQATTPRPTLLLNKVMR